MYRPLYLFLLYGYTSLWMTSPERSLGSNQVVLGGHDVAGVGNVHELLHRYGIEGEGHLHLPAIDTALEFAQATDASDEVDALVLAQVAQVEVDSLMLSSYTDGKQTVTVIINYTDTDQPLSLQCGTAKKGKLYTTSIDKDLQYTGKHPLRSLNIPARSITTVVVE